MLVYSLITVIFFLFLSFSFDSGIYVVGFADLLISNRPVMQIEEIGINNLRLKYSTQLWKHVMDMEVIEINNLRTFVDLELALKLVLVVEVQDL